MRLRRAIRQFHLSTAVILMFIAAILIFGDVKLFDYCSSVSTPIKSWKIFVLMLSALVVFTEVFSLVIAGNIIERLIERRKQQQS